ncbi:hypothetical protein V6U81_01540 [Micromonospora sp. CPCC 205711]|uniref:hypothetical protein n=1 Tax=Micromonospora sp. CPCC 205547 TaxID=3122400 RepID=UPI002FF37884
MTESGAYLARKRLLMSGTPELVAAGEVAFHELVRMRRLVRYGADLRSDEGHEAYQVRHGFPHRALSDLMRARPRAVEVCPSGQSRPEAPSTCQR